eukprot:scaffold41985_cov21-Tisochrysis_lutea.AAC.6
MGEEACKGVHVLAASHILRNRPTHYMYRVLRTPHTGGRDAGKETGASQGGMEAESGEARCVGPAELLSTGEAPALQ